ncbi:hypothetical protein [Thioclava sp. FTW29]|uniref:DUF1772 domain-containing protein n=1 Tax=Thioclava litoralis TaxID=3076557 RepID=A0ABZ1E5L6_9RHOB|nr:hypothetical protein RPE78_15080 [Thioclava sp. FTW29]
MLLTAKILLTLATLGYSAIPLAFDSNKTHWFNDSWTPHGRFHCVWQVMSYVYMALIALGLIWTASSVNWQIWLSAGLAACAYGGFWTAVALRKKLGLALVDDVNGVPPFMLPVLGECDANVTLFTTAVILLGTGAGALSLAAATVAAN